MLGDRAIGATAWGRFARFVGGGQGCTAGSVISPEHLAGRAGFRRDYESLQHDHARALRMFSTGFPLAPVAEITRVRAARLPGAIANSNVACPSVRRWSRARHHGVLFGWFWRGRPDIRTLTFREWAAKGQVWVRRGGCVADEAAKRTVRLDTAFVSRGKDAVIDAGQGVPGYRASPAGDRRQVTGHGNPARTCPVFRGGRPGGNAPERASLACGQAGSSGGSLGSGDRASLPGRSTRYRVIWLVCAHCGAKVAWLFYDERDIPVCVNAEHGPMELRR
jgi:hypothetical protein